MADKKISELDNLLSIDGTGDFLVIVDGDAGATKKTSVDTLIGDKISAVELSVNNPRTFGFAADINTIGQGLNGTRWIKVDSPDTAWEQILISESGIFSANIELAEASGIVPDTNVLASNDGIPSFGDGETIGGRELAFAKTSLAAGYQRNYFAGWVGAWNSLLYSGVDFKFERKFGYTKYGGTGDFETLGKAATLSSIGAQNYVVDWTPFPVIIDFSAGFSFSSVTAVHLNNNVIELGDLAFYFCGSLTAINFPDGLLEIGASAFDSATSLAIDFVAPNSLKVIENGAFWNSALTAVTFNNKLEYVLDYAFQNNDIVNLDLGESVEVIGADCFKDNNIVGDLAIPDSLSFGFQLSPSRSGIENGAFENNTGLGDVYANIDAEFFNSGALRNAGTGNLYVTSGNISSYGGAGASWGTKTVAEWTNYPTIPN